MGATNRLLMMLKTRGSTPTSGAGGQPRSDPPGCATTPGTPGHRGPGQPARRAARGRGRPRRVWSLTDRGEARFPDSHAQLTLELIGAVREEFGEDGLDRLVARRERDTLRLYGAALAGAADLRDRVERLAQAQRRGYMAEAQATTDGMLLVENHCVCAAAAISRGVSAGQNWTPSGRCWARIAGLSAWIISFPAQDVAPIGSTQITAGG